MTVEKIREILRENVFGFRLETAKDETNFNILLEDIFNDVFIRWTTKKGNCYQVCADISIDNNIKNIVYSFYLDKNNQIFFAKFKELIIQTFIMIHFLKSYLFVTTE